MPRFSIMVPVYNKSKYLKVYFNKILNQTYEDYEIIVVDDCSDKDDSYDYLFDLATKNQKIKLYRNSKNMGLGLTRNILLDNSSGDYLIFVDPDDYVEECLLKKINDALIEDIDIIRFQNVSEPMSDNQKVIESTKNPYRFSCNPTGIITGEEALLQWCLGERKINTMPWTYCIRRELYKGVRYPDSNILEDFAITPYLLASAKKVKAIEFVGYHYLQHDDSLTKSELSMEDKLVFYQKKLKLFKNIIELTKQNINNTDISDEAKSIFFADIDNRYNIREEKCKMLEKNM